MNVELMTPHFVQDVSHEDAVNVWLRPSVHGGVVHEIVPRGTETKLLTVWEFLVWTIISHKMDIPWPGGIPLTTVSVIGMRVNSVITASQILRPVWLPRRWERSK